MFHANDILNSVKEVHQSMMNVLNSNRTNNMVSPAASAAQRSGTNPQDVIEINSTGVGNRVMENGRYYYVWGGQFHNVPRGAHINHLLVCRK